MLTHGRIPPLMRGFAPSLRLACEVQWESVMVRGAQPWWDEGPVAGAPGMEPGHAFPFTREQAPHFYHLVADVQRRLGCPDALELRQQSSLFSGNARILLAPPIEIHLFRPALALDEDGIEAQIGHELGHYLVHRTEVCAAPPRLVECALKRDPTAASLTIPYTYAGEITADRFGLLACLDLAGALRLDFVIGTGLLPDAVGFDVDDYLADCNRTMEALRRAEQPIGGTTHPEHAFRSYALGLFWRSDRFQQLTGLGPADVALAEVDERLTDLLMPGWRAEASRVVQAPNPAAPAPDTRPRGGMATAPARRARQGAPSGFVGIPGVGHPATVPVESPPEDQAPPSDPHHAHEVAHQAALAEERERRHEAARWHYQAPWDAMGNIEERLRALDLRLGED